MTGKFNKVHIEANTLEHALVKAAGALGTTQDGIEYEIVKQSGRGVLSFFFGQKTEIFAWKKRLNKKPGTKEHSRRNMKSPPRKDHHFSKPEQTRKPEESHSPTIESQSSGFKAKKQLTQPEIQYLVKDIKNFCKDICTKMTGLETTVIESLENDRLILNVENESLLSHMAKGSKLIEAIEHLLRKKPHHLKQELPFKIFIDVQGERQKREGELVQMAKDLSEKVYENQRPIVLNYKNSYDRKIIHMALDKDERVYTKSIGVGSERKLMILPINRQNKFEDSSNTRLDN